MVDPWVVEHKTFIEKMYNDRGQQRTDGDILKEHNSTFLQWFKEHIIANPPEEGSKAGLVIYALAHGPSPNLVTYQEYDINGYTFYLLAKTVMIRTHG